MEQEQEVAMMARALEEFSRYLEEIQPKQWQEPTPDAEWSVRDLVRHMVHEVLWVPDLLAGHTLEQVGAKYEGDVLGADPKAAWRAAAERATTAVHSLFSLEHTVHLSYGDVPARTYLQHQIIDLTIHAWDLARAIKAPEKLDPALVHAAHDWFSPQAEDWRGAGLMAPAVRVPAEATLQEQLIALSGRNPSDQPKS